MTKMVIISAPFFKIAEKFAKFSNKTELSWAILLIFTKLQ